MDRNVIININTEYIRPFLSIYSMPSSRTEAKGKKLFQSSLRNLKDEAQSF